MSFISASVYWKHPLLLHTKEPITKPLTSLPSEDLHQRAVELFRSCHMFMNLAIDSPQIDYHVSLAQNILEVCLQHSELQNEIYCQLIKQTSRHPAQHKSGVQVKTYVDLCQTKLLLNFVSRNRIPPNYSTECLRQF